MTAEIVIWRLGEWAVRAAVLAAVAGALLRMLRVKDVSIALAVWTAMLAGALLIPIVAIVAPQVSISAPETLLRQAASLAPAASSMVFPAQARQPLQNDSRGLAASVVSVKRPSRWPVAAASLWFIVAALMLMRLFFGWWLSRRLMAASKPLGGAVCESDAVTVPITTGLTSPVILLPADWREWNQPKLEAVLAHEQSHVRRHDPLRMFAASVYRSVCWFHPLSWWLCGRLSELAESASDDAALTVIKDRALYAETLADFFVSARQRVRWHGVAMARAGRATRRIERILDTHRRLSASLTWGALVALVVLAIPVVYLAAAVRPVRAGASQTASMLEAASPAAPIPSGPVTRHPNTRPSRGQADTPTERSACGTTAYAKWLNEDAAYIISPAERAAFEKLRSKQECSGFIEQFWLRRDPTPGTSKNEFKEEHYRRICYANERFSAGTPGWKTDRGRIYITFGPPDEIESFYASRGEEPSRDIWHYQSLKGLGMNRTFEFWDANGTGDYRLVRQPPRN